MNKEMTVTDWPMAAPVGAPRSLLAEDLVIDGDVSSTGPVDITGRITGSVRAPDVNIADTGRVSGHVTALTLAVFGAIDGKITAKSVTLASTAKVRADVMHELISIETGALFEGSLKRNA